MSSNARWRRSKIVEASTPSRTEELVGGLKNALDRGETLAKAKQSFLNAGYKPEEINAAVQKMPTTTSQTNKPVARSVEKKAPETQSQLKKAAQPLPATTNVPGKKQELSNKFIIILISIAVLVLIGAALLGLFWNKIF